ncbi:MAG: M20/M25/M40 family metallo-hydrolase [Candidatus Protistobacter heckmanni]|nr:M20/M25/M40 family metallo-hydrolase [Candidatus Protistobacter heckmanni]
MAEMLKPDFDPELRVFARAASDDKGPIGMFLAAADLMAKYGLKPAVKVKVIIDSEEEINSPGISAVVAANKALLAADGLVIHDSATHPSGRPTAIFGNRGLTALTLTVYGPRAPLHSGHFGNYAPNPALLLARLLTSMKDENGKVLIPGYYDTTKLSEDDLKVLRSAGDDEAALLKRIGQVDHDKVAPSYQEALQYPSLNIRGMAAASVGDKVANIIPRDATAELDLRTTTEANGEYLAGLIAKHVKAQGFQVLSGPPTEEERAKYPKLASIKLAPAPAEAARQPLDSPIRRWTEKALEQSFAAAGNLPSKPVLIRAMDATVPTYEISHPLGLPFVLVPTVNADNNQHTYDENLRLGNYPTGIRTMLGLLSTPY